MKTNTIIYIPQNHPVHTVYTYIKDAGYDLRIVGGYVRDMIINPETNPYALDMDLATTASPDTVQSIFEQAGYKVLPIGIEHGTVRVVFPCDDTHIIFEITTLRQDIKTNGRHAVVSFSKDWHVDAHRRDFTSNALYADMTGVVYDYVGGLDDIQKKHLRFIGDAKHRIEEDALRILRFWRFQVKTGWDYTDNIFPLFQEMAPYISHLSRERIRDEMIKMLSYAHSPTDAFKGMQDCGVMARILPFPITSGIPLMGNMVENSTDIYAKIIALCNGEYKAVKTLGDVWMLSKHQKRQLQKIMTVYNDRAFVVPMVHKFLYYYGYKSVLSAGILKHQKIVDAIESYMPYDKPVFPVSGSDLITMGVPEGVKLGAMLKALEAWWVEHECRPKKQDCLLMVHRLQR